MKKGSSSENCFRNVSLVDIFPTLTELCGIPTKEGISGHSLIPLLENPEIIWNYPALTSLGDKNYSVRLNEWHYINYNGADEELYNLDDDPEEWTNLAIFPSSKQTIDSLNLHIPLKGHKLV